MERESFIFYRSFYEAIRGLPDNIRLEVFTAITEYALYGKEPEKLKPFARGMFTLVKPNLDANISRYENGRKGGRKPSAANPSAPPEENPAPAGPPAEPSASAGPPAEPSASAGPPAEPSASAGLSQGENPPPTDAAFLEAFFKDTISVEAFCLNNGIRPDALRRIAEEIVTEWRLAGQTHESEQDARRHLINQARIKINSLNTKSSPNDPTPKDRRPKRRGADSAALSPEDYTGEI